MRRKSSGHNLKLLPLEVFVPSRFLDSLNRPTDKKYPPITAKAIGAATYWKLATLSGLTQDEIFQPVEAFLRYFVDEWIATGRESSNPTSPNWECPQNRDLTKALQTCAAIKQFTEHGRLELVPSRWGLLLDFGAHKLQDSFGQEIRDPSLMAASEMALFFMADNDFRYKVAHCVNCGRYFMLKMWKNIFKRGTFCISCQRIQSLEGAKATTERNRAAAQEQLYELAAARFAEELGAPDWSKQFREKVANYLNGQIHKTPNLRAVYCSGSRDGVTSSWLSRREHQQAIIEAVRRL